MGFVAHTPADPLTLISKVRFSIDAPGGWSTIVVERPVDSEPTSTQSVSTVPEEPHVPSETFIDTDSLSISRDADHGMEIIRMTIAKAV